MGYNLSEQGDTHVVVVAESGSYINENNRFPVDSTSRFVGGLSGLTGSLKWEKSTSDLDLINGSYVTFWQKSETGALFGALFKLDEEDTDFRVEVDGEVIFEISLKDELKDEFDLENDASALEAPYLTNYKGKKYRFQPPEPLFFNSSIKLEVKASKNNKDLEGYLITWKSS